MGSDFWTIERQLGDTKNSWKVGHWMSESPKINSKFVPKNQRLEDEISFGDGLFSEIKLVVSGRVLFNSAFQGGAHVGR